MGDLGQPLEMREVERSWRADRQAHAMQRQGIKLADRLQAPMRRSARAHIVLGVNFKKSELRLRFDDRVEMLGLETDAHGAGAVPPIVDSHALLLRRLLEARRWRFFAAGTGRVTRGRPRAL